MVTSNSSPDSSSGKRQTLFSPSARKETYERGLATIPLPTLSRRVHAPVTPPQQSGKSRVIRLISIWVCQFESRICARTALTSSRANLTRARAVVACSLPVLALRTDCRRTLPATRAHKSRAQKNSGAPRCRASATPSPAGAALALLRRQPIGSVSIRYLRKDDYGLGSWCDHEQRITSHLNLSSDQCRYDHRMRVRGDFRTLAGLFVGLAGIRTDRRVRGLFG